MREKSGGEGNAEAKIESYAQLDAQEYITLMRRVSPESLVPDSKGALHMNGVSVEGDQFFKEKISKYNLTGNEIIMYLLALEEKVKQRLLQ